MGLPPPKLRDITSKIGETSSAVSPTSTEIWEIGVPTKNSLYWSIVISYLMSASDTTFSSYLKQLIGSKTEASEIKKKKGMSAGKINAAGVRQELRTFNPFKNRFTFFHWKNIEEVFRIFALRLKRKSSNIKSKNDDWNNELKLRAAAQLLDCIIEVYFPDEPNQEKLTYQASTESTVFPPIERRIVLFQHKDQAHGKIKDTIDIFYFGMNVQFANFLKLEACVHVMKKANIPNESIAQVKQLMKEEENHSFLFIILKSKWIYILPYLYKSPYIALKLHEAGFETDPTAVKDKNLSPFYHASINANTKYIRILYDYASNCRCLLDKSVRNADKIVLENLRKIKTTLEGDIQQIQKANSKSGIEQRALNILYQYFRFAEYQFQTANEITYLKSLPRPESELNLRKEVIKSILEQYLSFFQCTSSKDISNVSEGMYLCDISKTFDNYLQFSEFYENTDNFAYTIFFDNFYLLKKNIDVKYESITSNIEMKMLCVILSNKHFSPECETVHSKRACETNQNLLTHITLYHRNVLEDEIRTFVNYLKSEGDPQSIKGILREKNCLGSFCPEIADELMLMRLQKYITAALDVSPLDDGIKAVLTVEKTLQVIGESIKRPTAPDQISSYLLRSCLPSSLQKELIHIRDILSHYRNNTVEGKLQLEEDLKFWDDVRGEIRQIRDAFKIVGKTQSYRTMEFLMNSAMAELKEGTLKDEIMNAFNQKLYNKIQEERENYNRYHTEYANLLLNIINDLLEIIKEAELYEKDKQKKQPSKRTDTHGSAVASGRSANEYCVNCILGSIKAMEYLMTYIFKQTNDKEYSILLMDVRKLIETYPVDDNPLNERYLNGLNLLISKCKKKLSKENEEFDSYPKIESICNTITQMQFTGEDLDQIIVAINEAYEESEEAKDRLKELVKKSSSFTEEEMEELLRKIILKCDLSKLRNNFQNGNMEEFLEQQSISIENLVRDAKNMISENSVKKCCAKTLLTKIAFQTYLKNKIYLKVRLSRILCTKLEQFIMRRTTYLLNRLGALKGILIEEDEEINRAWTWGRSDAMKYHTKFLMRQRYVKEVTFCAPLETIFFDCLNILKMKDFEELSEKPDKLFTGVNLRNVISHISIFDVIGGILDEDDFPSEMIKKMLELIEDSETIESLSKLIRKCGTLEKERFEVWIDNCDCNHELVKKMKNRSKKRGWNYYLFLFPWI